MMRIRISLNTQRSQAVLFIKFRWGHKLSCCFGGLSLCDLESPVAYFKWTSAVHKGLVAPFIPLTKQRGVLCLEVVFKRDALFLLEHHLV
jgi:hypothetical protein